MPKLNVKQLISKSLELSFSDKCSTLFYICVQCLKPGPGIHLKQQFSVAPENQNGQGCTGQGSICSPLNQAGLTPFTPATPWAKHTLCFSLQKCYSQYFKHFEKYTLNSDLGAMKRSRDKGFLVCMWPICFERS